MALRTIIIEDNEFDQLILKKFIDQDDELQLMETFVNAKDAMSRIKALKPDLIFLDVEMPEMSGIEFLNSIKEVPQIIMITNHQSYAIDAFENDVTDFIIKPPNKDRYEKAVSKAKKINEWLILDAEDDRFIYIRVDREDIKILLKEILYVEAKADYVRVQTKDKKYLVLSTMKSIATKLPIEDFVRIHRSFIVNVSNIQSYNGNEVSIGEISIPVSRNGKKELKKSSDFK